MKTKFGRLLSKVRVLVGPTFRRFWVSVAFTVAVTTTSIMATTGRFSDDWELMGRVSLALLAGLLTSWCTILSWERRVSSGEALSSDATPATGNIAALLLSAVVAGGTFAMVNGMTFVSVSRHVAICAFLLLMFFIIPNLRRTRSFEVYIVRLFSQAVVAVMFAAVMFLGLAAIALTVSALFSLTVPSDFYIRIWLVMFGVLAPFIFMAGIPGPEEVVEDHSYPKILNNLVLYVVTPLLTAYSLILFAYFAKILITWQWPVGLVGHLVLWYSLVGTAVLYFVWPLALKNKWAEAFSKYFTIALIPLLVMMFVSMGIRIKYYGITENRYYVLVVGLWVLGSMLYLNLSRAKKSIVLPISLAIVVLFSVLGPWSSFSVSKWSQNRRLEGLCTKYGMIRDGSIVPSSEVSPSDRDEIRAIVQYFDRYHDLSDVRVLPEGFTLDQFDEVFGFSYVEGESGERRRVQYVAGEYSLDIGEFQYLFHFTEPFRGTDRIHRLSQGDVGAAYDRDNQRITVTLAGKMEWEQCLTEFVLEIQSKYGATESAELLPGDMVIEAETPDLRIKVVVVSISATVDPVARQTVVHEAEFVVLVGKVGHSVTLQRNGR